MRRSLLICALSAALVASPAAAERAAEPAPSENVFAVAGACVWAPSRRENALGAAFISEAATSLVRSFAAALQAAAAGTTRVSSATLMLDPQRHECIQFVRGALSVTASEADTGAALRDYLPAAAHQDAAARLFANGVRLSGPPGLIAEVRLHTIRESAGGGRLVVMEPTFIGYREPSFRQMLRFWDGDERSFAFQLQMDEAPKAPAAIASGGQVQLGARRPSWERLHIDMGDAPSPGSSLAFEMKAGQLYNARVSVSESSSASAFMTFWANVIAAAPVQTAAAAALQDAVSEDRRDAADRTAYAAYATKRSELGALINACPLAANDAARAWVITDRAKLVQAIRAYASAAADAGVSLSSFPDLAPEAGVDEIVAWCAATRTFLHTH
ncbi:MAG: hypothetical protein KF700_06675 [Hyphomonadaceae bacterium]|nr:hypothetical protein [Hyphomonadaceae bacterium]